MSKIKKLCTVSMLIAVSVVLGAYLTVRIGGGIKITFKFVTVFMSAYLFGPIVGGLVGLLSDIIFLKSDGFVSSAGKRNRICLRIYFRNNVLQKRHEHTQNRYMCGDADADYQFIRHIICFKRLFRRQIFGSGADTSADGNFKHRNTDYTAFRFK